MFYDDGEFSLPGHTDPAGVPGPVCVVLMAPSEQNSSEKGDGGRRVNMHPRCGDLWQRCVSYLLLGALMESGEDSPCPQLLLREAPLSHARSPHTSQWDHHGVQGGFLLPHMVTMAVKVHSLMGRHCPEAG